MRRRWSGVLVLACALAGAPVVPLAGQEGPPLTLEDALAIARSSNPTFRQAQASLELNGAERRATLMSQVFPSVELNLLRTGYDGFLTRRATDFFGNPIENPVADWVYNSNTSQGITLNWTLQGTSILDALSRSSRTNLNRELQVGTRGWALDAQVRRLFFEALEQRELLAVEEAIRESRDVDLESARRLFAIAQRSQVDVLTAELQVEQQRLNVEQQRRAYLQATLALSTYLGEPELATSEPVAVQVPLFDPSTLEASELVAEALRGNPELRETESSVAGARLGVRESRRTWWPTLNVNYRYGRLAQTQEGGAFFDLGNEPNDIQSSFNVFLSFPIFNNWFQDRADQVQAQVNLETEEETLRERRLQVEERVRTELLNLENQYRTQTLATRSAEIASQAVRLAREEYRLGTRTFEQLQEAVTQEADAQRQVIQARFGFMDALLALEEALGRRLRPGTGGGEG